VVTSKRKLESGDGEISPLKTSIINRLIKDQTSLLEAFLEKITPEIRDEKSEVARDPEQKTLLEVKLDNFSSRFCHVTKDFNQRWSRLKSEGEDLFRKSHPLNIILFIMEYKIPYIEMRDREIQFIHVNHQIIYKMDYFKQNKSTIISAPAGFGKTVVMCWYLKTFPTVKDSPCISSNMFSSCFYDTPPSKMHNNIVIVKPELIFEWKSHIVQCGQEENWLIVDSKEAMLESFEHVVRPNVLIKAKLYMDYIHLFNGKLYDRIICDEKHNFIPCSHKRMIIMCASIEKFYFEIFHFRKPTNTRKSFFDILYNACLQDSPKSITFSCDRAWTRSIQKLTISDDIEPFLLTSIEIESTNLSKRVYNLIKDHKDKERVVVYAKSSDFFSSLKNHLQLRDEIIENVIDIGYSSKALSKNLEKFDTDGGCLFISKSEGLNLQSADVAIICIDGLSSHDIYQVFWRFVRPVRKSTCLIYLIKSFEPSFNPSKVASEAIIDNIDELCNRSDLLRMEYEGMLLEESRQNGRNKRQKTSSDD
jgi:hypothetical protein